MSPKQYQRVFEIIVAAGLISLAVWPVVVIAWLIGR